MNFPPKSPPRSSSLYRRRKFDQTWQSARAKANWEYQKFFGAKPANRAAMNAGRAAMSQK